MVTISWILWGDAALLLLLAYPLQVLRMSARGERPLRDRLARALFVVLDKFPEMLGQLQFWVSRTHLKAARSFDYKA